MNIPYTQKEIDIIKQFYHTLGIDKVCKMMGRSRLGVFRQACKLGLEIRKRKIEVPADIAKCIISDYNAKTNIDQLSKKYKYGIGIIRRTLVDGKIEIRSFGEHSKKHTLNETYFDKIDTFEKAYLLGFIYADGNISKDSRTRSTYWFQVRLQKRDRCILEQMKRAFESSHPIYETSSGYNNSEKKFASVGLTISNNKFCAGMMNKGVDLKKSLILKFPDKNIIPEHLLGAFILGYFDGDGSVTYNLKTGKWTANFCGTEDFLIDLSVYLAETFGICPKKMQHHRNPNIDMWRMGWGGQTMGRPFRSCDIWHIYHFMYSGHNLGIKRKKNQMDGIVKHYAL